MNRYTAIVASTKVDSLGNKLSVDAIRSMQRSAVEVKLGGKVVGSAMLVVQGIFLSAFVESENEIEGLFAHPVVRNKEVLTGGKNARFIIKCDVDCLVLSEQSVDRNMRSLTKARDENPPREVLDE